MLFRRISAHIKSLAKIKARNAGDTFVKVYTIVGFKHYLILSSKNSTEDQNNVPKPQTIGTRRVG